MPCSAYWALALVLTLTSSVTSRSSTTEKCVAVNLDRDIASAIFLRTPLNGMRSSSSGTSATEIGLGAAIHLQYQISYVAFCAAPYYIIVAHGVARVPWRLPRIALVTTILAYSANSLRSNYFYPYKENYRDALASVANQFEDGDCAIFSPGRRVPRQWAIYGYDEIRPDLRVSDPETILDSPDSCRRIWLTVYRRVRLARELGEADIDLLSTSYRETVREEYHWIRVVLFEPRPNP